MYAWTNYLATFFHKMTSIKKYHHFSFTKSVHGSRYRSSVMLKCFSMSWAAGMPPMIEPQGLDHKCQWYLYQEIRQFVSNECQDTVAPLPTVPRPGTVENVDDSDVPAKRSHGQGRGHGRARPKKWWYWWPVMWRWHDACYMKVHQMRSSKIVHCIFICKFRRFSLRASVG